MRLPRDVIQPFDLGLIRDDLHAMAFFRGHPRYESVEAMVRLRAGGAAVRCIFTRHDQTQVDCVNDPALAGPRRETHVREIRFESAPGPHVRVVLESPEGEPVVLDVPALAPPSERFGGLTDPGSHSPTASFPLMWRGKSTLGGPGTHVRFGHQEFPAWRSHLTEGHTLALLRAGTRTLDLSANPFRPSGEEQGSVRLERAGTPREWVVGRFVAGCLDVSEIGFGPGLLLRFDPEGGFAIQVEVSGDAVTGTWGVTPTSIRLCPEKPTWAQLRALEVHRERTRDMLTLTSTIAPMRRKGD
ncbi:MAG TPA: hypothetical protein VLV15_06250 [Dongiaceae bacterium]|nr:hypothetical protein [Dongiaceae bacterium]